MPAIRPSSDLRNSYNEISDFFHRYPEPIFITKNSQRDLAVMSIETYELLGGKMELHKLLEEGLGSERSGKVRLMKEVFSKVRTKLSS